VRVVLDTNVLLSAIFTRGICEALLDATIESDAFTVVLSEHILAEFERHALRKFGATPAHAAAAVEFLRRHSQVIAPAHMPANSCPDRDDLPVLGTAVAGGVDALVTGDAELRGLADVRGIPIWSPREFYDRLS